MKLRGLSRRTAGFLVGGGVILVVFAYLLWGGIGQNLVYFVTPGELLAKGPEVYGASIRLGGMVEPGSVRWNAETRELRFRLQDGDHSVEVLSSGAPPQMFSPGIGAVVEGTFTSEGVFHSHNVMVKHSNEYRAPKPDEHPAEYYRQLFKQQAS